jgi:toxin YoeB
VRLIFHPQAWEDYLHWQDCDGETLARLNTLIRECGRTPLTGIGKPEPLRGQLAGWWSRRMTSEHRLVYRREGEDLLIAQCRNHY